MRRGSGDSVQWGCALAGALALAGSLAGCKGDVESAAPDASNGTSDSSTSVDSDGSSDAGPEVEGADSGAFRGATNPPGFDGSACRPVVAADYDQSCATDTDCVSVSEVPSCPVSAMFCYDCPLATINASAMTPYRAAFSAALAGLPPTMCNCPQIGVPCCRSGMCQPRCSSAPADTLPACADAGGSCVFPARDGCGSGTQGPAAACAYADETCCLP